MLAHKILTNTQSKVRICINAFNNYDISGEVLLALDRQVKQINSIYQLLIILDEYFDYHNIPQATHHRRRFSNTKKRSPLPERSNNVKEEYNPDKNGNMATFVVHVMYRQNSSWQGKIEWIETNKKVNFRSSLELIMLMNEALEQGAEKKITWEDSSNK